MHTKIIKILLMAMLLALVALPVHAWSYDDGRKIYCGVDGCYSVDDVRPVRYYYQYGNDYRYKYYNGHNRDIDVNIDIDIDCNGRCDDYMRYRRYYYDSPYVYGNTRNVRYAEYTYPYNHRVVRTGYPYYTTTRYPYW